MSKYSAYLVADYDNRRTYKQRQLYANDMGADLFIELHFNGKRYDKPGTQDNPASVLVADNASLTSKSVANRLAHVVSSHYKFPNRGVDILDSDRNGYWNIYYTKMPAVLTELLYVSDKEQAEIAISQEGQRKIAEMHFQVIREHFPDGATTAISLGHLYKPEPHHHDRGAPISKEVHNPKGLAEADCAAGVARELMAMMQMHNQPSNNRLDGDIFLEGEWSMKQRAHGILLSRVS